MATNSDKTIVQVAGGDIKAFGDFASKFIVSHPKTAVIIAAVAANLLGVLLHI